MVTATHPPTAQSAEHARFLELLPELRAAHANEYVAVSGEGVLAHGPHLDAVVTNARATGEPFYCGWVEPGGGTVIRFASPLVVEEAV